MMRPVANGAVKDGSEQRILPDPGVKCRDKDGDVFFRHGQLWWHAEGILAWLPVFDWTKCLRCACLAANVCNGWKAVVSILA